MKEGTEELYILFADNTKRYFRKKKTVLTDTNCKDESNNKYKQKQQAICKRTCCLLYAIYIGFTAVFAVSIVEHYLLFRGISLDISTKKDIKFFGTTFLSRKVTKISLNIFRSKRY